MTSTGSEIERMPASINRRRIHHGVGTVGSTPVTRRATKREQPVRSSMWTGHTSPSASGISTTPGSPLHPGSPGNRLKDYLSDPPDLLVTKSVNSSFHGTPDLHAWLLDQGLAGIVVCGITTNHCCETTARVGGNLGHDVLFVLDATHTFDRTGPDGTHLTADELAHATATNLHGEFATVVSTADLLAPQPR